MRKGKKGRKQHVIQFEESHSRFRYIALTYLRWNKPRITVYSNITIFYLLNIQFELIV